MNFQGTDPILGMGSLSNLSHAAVIYNDKIVETNMDEIESQIVLDYYFQDKEFIEEKAYA